MVAALILVLIGCIAVLFLLVQGVVVLAMRLPSSEAQCADWRQLAKKYRASFSHHGWWRRRPWIRFKYREAMVAITMHSRRHRWSTHMNMFFQPELSDPQTPTPAATWQLNQLNDALRPASAQFNLAPGRLEIVASGALWGFEPLQHLLRCGLAVYDQLRLARAEGIEFVEPIDMQPLEAVRCRVCGQLIEHDLVYCRVCKTPHHQECWEYNGQCSTYACGEVRFVTPET